ncbi:Ubp3 associated protein Bre5 [Corynebacterium fournieri]|nr:Ubp3 associated protein Bre5 [Corynebacterium fournieri]
MNDRRKNVPKRRQLRRFGTAAATIALALGQAVSVDLPTLGAAQIANAASSNIIQNTENVVKTRVKDSWLALFTVNHISASSDGRIQGFRLDAPQGEKFLNSGTYTVDIQGQTIPMKVEPYEDSSGSHLLATLPSPVTLRQSDTVFVKYQGSDQDAMPSQISGFEYYLAPVAHSPQTLNLTNASGGGDPLFSTDACVTGGEGEKTDVTTWISTSYFGQKTKTQTAQRNRTYIRYRDLGSSEFTELPKGDSDWVYNSLAYNPADGYLYAISQDRPLDGSEASYWSRNIDKSRIYGTLLRISPVTGEVAPVGEIKLGSNLNDPIFEQDAHAGFTNGAFDTDGNYIFANNASNGSGRIYRLSGSVGEDNLWIPSNNSSYVTAEATTLSGARPQNSNDWAFAGLEQSKFIWSISSTYDKSAPRKQTLFRTDTESGVTVSWDITDLGLPNGAYGNAWTYGNGNLGFSENSAAKAFEIHVTNPEIELTGSNDSNKSQVVASLVGTEEKFPTGYNNDATTNAYVVAQKPCPEPANPGLELKKFINGRDEHALVNAGENMTITYRITNTGATRIEGILLKDQVKENNAELQQAVNDQLGSDPFDLEPGESRDVEVTVKAPVGRHDNTARLEVPPTVALTTVPEDDASSDSPQLELLKEIKREDEGEDAWRDAEKASDALPIGKGERMQLRYTVRNTGSVALSGVDVVDKVTRLDDGNADEYTKQINAELEKVGRGLELGPGDEKAVVITVAAPGGYHVNEASATAPPVTATETVVSSVPGTTNENTTVPGTLTTKTTVVERVPNTPTNKAQSTPTSEVTPPPVVENPQFSVEKLSNQSAINLERNQEGKYAYTAEYTIIVRNDGKGDGEHADIYDVPLRGVGFELNSVQVDGQDAQLQNGRYKIADGAALAAGESKTFTVTVSGTISDAAAGNLPAAYGQCKADGTDLTKDSGLVNVVNMDGDSDGPDNNIVCTPVELRRLNIEKRIDGREEAVVKPGEMMDIWYRVRNTGNVTLHDVKLSDNVQENNDALQQEITKQLNGQDTFDLEPGEIRDVHISVKAPKGEHVNEARADVPPTTIPPVTLPHTTVPGKPVPSTAVSTTAKAKSPKITIKKYVNGHDDGTAVAPGEDMEILYRVVNEGSMPVDGIRVVDKVTQATDKQGLQAAINAELAKEPAFKLEPGGVKEIRITVPAPAGGHVNEAVATAPVTVPGTTVPPVTVPPITKPSTTIPGSTVPGTTVPSTVVTVTAPPDEGRSESPQLEIKKFINGRDEGDVLAADAETMEITYRVTNTGASVVKGITIADEVTEGEDIPNLKAGLDKVEPFDLAPGAFKDVTIKVTAPKGGHVNVAKPVVPPVTVPATTIPGTTNPNTTIPPTTVPERTVTPTTTPSDDARSNVVKLELLKDIWSNDTNNWKTADKVDEAADAAVVDANGKMRIRYTVKNTGSLPVSGIGIVDEVTELTKGTDEDKKALTDAINAELKKYGEDITLQPGKSRAVEITVDAPKQRHINVAKVTAPPVTTLPGSTIPGTTVMTTTNGSTVPVTTVTPRVVEPSTVTPNTPSNTAHATPTTSTTVPPAVVPDPQFAVEKLGNQSGISLERNKDGKYGYSAEYTIRVRNTGQVAGEHAKVWDVPVRGVGFDIANVTVDGAEVKPNSGRYLISDKAELAVGEYKDYQVVVNGTLADKAADALPAAVGQCEAVTPGNPGAGSGLVNTVQMAGDSDGPDNNIVCEPVELRRLNIEKRIDGRENAPVTPGEKMEIWYRIRNTGNVTLSGITLADQIKEDNPDLQKEIDDEIAKIEAFDLEPGEVKDITFPVTAYAGEHENEVRAEVPETTRPGTTRPETSIPETTVPPVTVPGTTNPETTVPGTTIPGSTVPATTIPGTTVPGRSVPPTTVTATAHANSPKLEIKKYINGYDEGTQVAPGEDMEILYRVANTGSVRIDGIRLDDEVTEAADEQVSKALQRDIDAALKNEAPFALEPGEVREVRITVPAPAGGHVNVAKPIVPPVTVPGTTIPGTTNPNTTVPGTTVPSTVVTVTTPSDDARSDSPALDIKKYINNIDDGDIVTPGDDMVITYRVFNNGNVDAKGVTIADEVTEGSDATKADLTKQIEAELAKIEPFDVPAGEFRDVEITVKAPEGGHVNVAKPNVPPVTVPATTIPGTTNPNTTIPETTVPERVVTPTTTPSDDARSDSLKLEILKDIFSLADNEWHAADTEDDAAVVDANGKMRVRYTVTNTGSVALSGVDIVDNVTRLDEGDQQALTDALNSALEAEGRGFDLKPGEKKVVEITVDAPKGYHVNEAIATAPAVTTTQTQVTSVPGTTNATTTVPGSLTTTVVTTEKTPNVPTNTAQATPTTRQTPPPVPTPERPQFAVEKLGARAGNVALTRNDEGNYDYSNEYVIRVRNSGLVDGEHATIWDVPLRGAGFTVNEVTVDDKAVEVANGRYKIADAAKLAPGEYKDFHVTVTGTLAEAAADNLPEAVGQCDAEGANPGADSGLVNQVNMDGDSDGAGNNVVCTPVELRRLNIEKRIDGREDAVVKPGEKMEIWYRVRNTGNVELANIALADQIREDNQALQDEINAELAKKAEPFDLAPGAFHDIKIEVTAPEGEHNDEARAEVPPVTVPPVTRPETTIPGTTGPSTTVPPVTVPGTTLPGTTVPGSTVSTTARANSPQLSVKKFINGRDEHALVNAGEDMEITYRVTNNGTVRVDGVRLTDQVKEDNAELQQAIDAQLGKVDPFALEPGESREVTVTVKAPAGRHDDTVNMTVPPVTIPATTIPGTTNPNTTIPGTTVPSTVVTVTAPPDDASSDSPQLEILKEIKRADDGDDAWRDAETEADALPVAPGEAMQLRYTVRNTGSVELSGIDVVDEVTRLDEGDADEFTAEINTALEAEGRNFALAPGEEKVIVVTVTAPAGYHVNEAIATAPPVTATETVVSSVPGTTNETTTVPGTVTTETTVVERTPNTPTNKAQSTPTTGVAPCDCEIKTTTITPAPVTTTEAGKVTTVTPDPVTSEVTVTTTKAGKVTTVTPDPVTSEVTVTTTPAPVTTTEAGKVTTVTPDPVTSEVTVTTTPAPVVTTVEGPAVTETLPPITVTEVPTTLTTSTLQVDEGKDVLGRCIANAVRSPILYMVPLLLAGQVLGEVAAPYVKAVNDQFNKISSEIQDEIRRKTPNFGYGRRGEENEQVAELRAKAEAANRMLQELAMRPDVQQYGQWAAIAAGVVVAGSVLYDWCSNEPGEAFTAIGSNGSSSKGDVEVDGSSLRGRDDSVETIVAPVTDTDGSAEGSSE